MVRLKPLHFRGFALLRINRRMRGQLVVRLKPLHFHGLALLQRNRRAHSLADLENNVKLFMRSLSHLLETSGEVTNKSNCYALTETGYWFVYQRQIFSQYYFSR